MTDRDRLGLPVITIETAPVTKPESFLWCILANVAHVAFWFTLFHILANRGTP